MVQNPPEGTQRVVPYLNYADAPAAIDFLTSAFGFVERFRFADGDQVGHCELGLEDNVLMVASVYGAMGHASAKDCPGRYAAIMCYVDDVDAHFAHARGAGAKILEPPEDKFYGDRMYRAEDTEGIHWFFATHIKDVAPEDMVPPEA